MLADAAEAAGVRRYLMVSAMGTENADPDSDDVFQVYCAPSRPTTTASARATSTGPSYGPGTSPTTCPPAWSRSVGSSGRSVTRGNVAHVLAEALEADDAVGKTFDLINGNDPDRRGDPQALTDPIPASAGEQRLHPGHLVVQVSPLGPREPPEHIQLHPPVHATTTARP